MPKSCMGGAISLDHGEFATCFGQRIQPLFIAQNHRHQEPMTISISDELVVRVGNAEVALSPRAGLRLAEDLARKSFRRVLDQEAAKRVRSENAGGERAMRLDA
jgi:hypothetical protein